MGLAPTRGKRLFRSYLADPAALCRGLLRAPRVSQGLLAASRAAVTATQLLLALPAGPCPAIASCQPPACRTSLQQGVCRVATEHLWGGQSHVHLAPACLGLLQA